MSPAESRALLLLVKLRSALVEEPSAARTAALTKTMSAIVDAVGEQAILPLWAQCVPVDEATVRRTLSYILARHIESLDEWNWIALLWLLNSPGSNDESGVLNTLTTLQRHPLLTGAALAALRPLIGPFLADAIARAEVTRESAIEVIDALADNRMLREVLTEADIKRLSELLDAARDDTDRDGAALIDAAQKTLASERCPARLPEGADTLRTWNGAHEPREPDDKWSEVLSSGEAIGREYVARYAAFDSFAAGVESRFAAYDLRVSKHWADVGRVPFDFFQKLLSTWRRLYLRIREDVAPNALQPSVYLQAPAYGSFSTRILVEPPSEQGSVEEAVANELTNRLAGVTARGELVPEKHGAEYAAFFDVVSEYDVNLEVGVASSLRYRVRTRVVINAVRAKAAAVSIRRPAATTGEQVALTGTLDAANHRSGQFEIIPSDGSAPIKGVQRVAARAVLLRKTIGQEYAFTLLREGRGEATKWSIVALRRTGTLIVAEVEEEVEVTVSPPSPPATPPRAPQRVRPERPLKKIEAQTPKPTIPEQFTSALIPQVDNLMRVLQIAEILAAGRELIPKAVGLRGDQKNILRALEYMEQAARVLQVLDDDNTLTPAGAALVGLPAKRQVAFLAELFEQSLIGRAWMAWAGVNALSELDPHSAEAFLVAKKLTTSMAERRGRTLRRWAIDLKAGVLKPL